MKKILIIANRSNRRKWRESQAFVVALHHHGLPTDLIDYSDLSFLVQDAGRQVWAASKDIASYDVVYFRSLSDNRGLAASAALYLHEKRVPFLDREALSSQSFDKLQQMFMLSYAGLPIPASFLGQPDRLARLVEKGVFSFPLIVKAKVGSRGHNNHLVHDQSALNKVLVSQAAGYFIVQQCIPNQGDFRIVVMGSRARLAMLRQRTSTTTHLNNTSAGAQAIRQELADPARQEIYRLSEKAASLFGRDIAGVDIIVDESTNKPYILEVNRAPQLTAGAFVDEKMAAFAHCLEEL